MIHYFILDPLIHRVNGGYNKVPWLSLTQSAQLIIWMEPSKKEKRKKKKEKKKKEYDTLLKLPLYLVFLQ